MAACDGRGLAGVERGRGRAGGGNERRGAGRRGIYRLRVGAEPTYRGRPSGAGGGLAGSRADSRSGGFWPGEAIAAGPAPDSGHLAAGPAGRLLARPRGEAVLALQGSERPEISGSGEGKRRRGRPGVCLGAKREAVDIFRLRFWWGVPRAASVSHSVSG